MKPQYSANSPSQELKPGPRPFFLSAIISSMGGPFMARRADMCVHAAAICRSVAQHSRVVLWQAQREAGGGDDA